MAELTSPVLVDVTYSPDALQSIGPMDRFSGTGSVSGYTIDGRASSLANAEPNRSIVYVEVTTRATPIDFDSDKPISRLPKVDIDAVCPSVPTWRASKLGELRDTNILIEEILFDLVRHVKSEDQVHLANITSSIDKLQLHISKLADDRDYLENELYMAEYEIATLQTQLKNLVELLGVLLFDPLADTESTQNLLRYVKSTFTELPKKAVQKAVLDQDLSRLYVIADLATKAIQYVK